MITPLSGGVSGIGWTVGAVKYLAPTGFSQLYSSAAKAYIPCPITGTISKLYVEVGASVGVGNTLVFTLYKNGVATSLQATIGGSSYTTGNDASNSVAVTAGDLICIRVTDSGSPPTATMSWGWCMSLEGDTSTHGAVLGGGELTDNGTKYMTPWGQQTSEESDETLVKMIMPTAGTLGGLYAYAEDTHATYYTEVKVRVNGSAVISVNCTSSGVVFSSSSTQAVVANDEVSIHVKSHSASYLGQVSWGIKWVPTTSNEAIIGAVVESLDSSDVRFRAGKNEGTPSGSASNSFVLLPSGDITTFNGKLTSAPIVGTRTFYVYNDTSWISTPESFDIAYAATTGGFSGEALDFGAGHKMTLRSTVNIGAASSKGYFGLVFDGSQAITTTTSTSTTTTTSTSTTTTSTSTTLSSTTTSTSTSSSTSTSTTSTDTTTSTSTTVTTTSTSTTSSTSTTVTVPFLSDLAEGAGVDSPRGIRF